MIRNKARTCILAFILTLSIISGTASAEIIAVKWYRESQSGVSFDIFDVAIDGDYMYMNAARDGLRVVDIKNPDEPVMLDAGFIDPLEEIPTGSLNYSIAAKDGIVFLAYADKTMGYKVIDASDSYNMKQLSTIITCNRYPIDVTRPRSIYINGDYMFLGEGAGMRIFDIKDAKNPKLASVVDGGTIFKSSSSAGMRCLVANDKYAVAASYDSTNPVGLAIVDVSDPKNPFTLSVLRPDELNMKDEFFVEGIAIIDDYVCVTTKGNRLIEELAGIYLIDIKNPRSPFLSDVLVLPSTNDFTRRFRPQIIDSEDNKFYVGEYGGRKILELEVDREGKLICEKEITLGNGVSGLSIKDDIIGIASRTAGVSLARLGDVTEYVKPTPTPTPVATPTPTPPPKKNFSDTENHPSKEIIQTMADNGYVNGINETTFGVDIPISKSQLLAILNRSLAIEEIAYIEGNFSDVAKDDWFSGYIQSSIDNGLIDGNFIKNSAVSPNKNITREEAAYILYNAYMRLTNDKEVKQSEGFSDSSAISNWAMISAQFCRDSGIITASGEFAPKKEITRDSAVEMIYRLGNVIDEYESAAAYVDTGVPYILKVSDGIYGERLISVNGENFTKKTDFYVRPSIGKVAEVEVPEDAVPLEVIQLDEQGQFAVVKMEKGAPGVVYDIWAVNEKGVSTPRKMNEPRISCISIDEAWEGQYVYATGRNFDLAEILSETNTTVRLNDGVNSYEMEIVELNPALVKFKIGSQPAGTYTVELSNDGTDNFVSCEAPQKLRIVPVGKDPLDLGVAWANDFNWDNRENILDHGAVINDGGYDDEAVKSAITALKENGGGVVYFPIGTYNIRLIDLPANIVLLGEDRDKTKLLYTAPEDSTDNVFIRSSGDGQVLGKQGLSCLTIGAADESIWPDTFVSVGHLWGPQVNTMALRTAEKIFFKNFTIKYSMVKNGEFETRRNGNRGIAGMVIAKQKLLFDDSLWKGMQANLNRVYSNYYTYMRNNIFDYNEAYVVTVADYSFIIGNKIKGTDAGLDSHGFSIRSNTYVGDNTIEGVGTIEHNDGEAIMTEGPNNNWNYGNIVSADGKYVTVANTTTPVVMPREGVRYGRLQMVIVDGKGLGQHRTVKGVRGNDTYVLEKPFDIAPDSDSYFSLIVVSENITYYNNVIKNNTKGLWFYGYIKDGLMMNNTSIDSSGIFLHGTVGASQNRFQMCYYTRVVNNHIEGISRKCLSTGIGFQTGTNTNPGVILGATMYNFEVRDNSIVGVPKAVPVALTEQPPISGIYFIANEFVGYREPNGKRGDAKNMIAENNYLEDLNEGIRTSYQNIGIVMSKNEFLSVGREIVDPGAGNVINIR